MAFVDRLGGLLYSVPNTEGPLFGGSTVCSIIIILFLFLPLQLVHVCGNLKVQLSPSKTTSSGQLEFIKPSVIGFIGECRVVESVASILEISIPHSTFTVTRTLDMKKVISVEATYVYIYIPHSSW